MSMERVKVTGMKFFAGNIDGKDIDSGKVYIEEMLDNRQGRAKGYTSTEYALANAAAVKALLHNECPFEAEVEFQRMRSGDSTRLVVTDLRPVVVQPRAARVAQS